MQTRMQDENRTEVKCPVFGVSYCTPTRLRSGVSARETQHAIHHRQTNETDEQEGAADVGYHAGMFHPPSRSGVTATVSSGRGRALLPVNVRHGSGGYDDKVSAIIPCFDLDKWSGEWDEANRDIWLTLSQAATMSEKLGSSGRALPRILRE
jgi:hypothetical protein